MLLGLAGRAGAGKDTCGSILAADLGFATLAFADAVRAEIVRAFGIDPRMLTDRLQKEVPTGALMLRRCIDGQFVDLMARAGHTRDQPLSPRAVMRAWGTEYRRALFGADYWLVRAHETVERLVREGWRRIVITDVRFTNEAELVRMLRGQVWRIRRRSAEQQQGDHDSEREVDRIDADQVIHNDHTVDDLAQQLATAYGDALATH